MKFPPRRKRVDKKASKSTNHRTPKPSNGKAVVNAFLLAPNGSYDIPEFVNRGYYKDKPFVCKDCSKAEIWTALQQKWWFEIAKGDIFTQARRCRRCRRLERERHREARRVHLEGLAKKHTSAEQGAAANRGS